MTDAAETTAEEISLDVIYAVPARLADDERYVRIFWQVVNRLRADAKGIVLDTSNQLLIERIATVYVQIKSLEDAGTWRPGQQKDLNDHFVKLETEFHRQIAAASGDRTKERNTTIVRNVVDVVSTEIPDEHDVLRSRVLAQLGLRFQKLGI